jgi:hypothetical protein
MHPEDDCDGDFLREGLVSDFMLPRSDMIIMLLNLIFPGAAEDGPFLPSGDGRMWRFKNSCGGMVNSVLGCEGEGSRSREARVCGRLDDISWAVVAAVMGAQVGSTIVRWVEPFIIEAGRVAGCVRATVDEECVMHEGSEVEPCKGQCCCSSEVMVVVVVGLGSSCSA